MVDASDAALFLLDCDGVLVDSEPVAAVAVSQVLKSVGCNLEARECQVKFQGKHVGAILDYVAQSRARAVFDRSESQGIPKGRIF